MFFTEELRKSAEQAEQAEKEALLQAEKDETALSYVQSYYWLRVIVGALGIALPIMLLIGERFLDDASVGKRGSLSAYYHSGMRDVFTIVLAVVGILLITYKVSERNFDSKMTTFAGVAAIGVALFPTGIPSGVDAEPTPLQLFLTEDVTKAIHYICAFTFIFLLMRLCFRFARREHDSSHRHRWYGENSRRSTNFWFHFHWEMGRAIAVAIVFIAVMWLLEMGGVDKDAFLLKHKLFIGEWLAAWAFGFSWLAEGWDRDVLFHKVTTKASSTQVSGDPPTMPEVRPPLPSTEPAGTG